MAKALENTDSDIRGRLIDGALTMIDRDGIDGARLRDIVEHADLTTGSLYWFFKNRRALINAALAERYIRRNDVDPFAVAVLLQSTTIGLAAIDLAPDLVPANDSWSYLMERIVRALRP